MARYRFPLAPLLVPSAAYALVRTVDHLRQHRWRSVAIAAAVGLVTAVLANFPVHAVEQLDALAHMNVGVAFAKEGDWDNARKMFTLAVVDHPGSAEAQNNLAQVMAVQGDFEDAIVHYRAALDIAPELIGVHFNLGVALEGLGRMEEAARSYRRAYDLNPDDFEARDAWRRLGGS